jgi:hypothetical protein
MTRPRRTTSTLLVLSLLAGVPAHAQERADPFAPVIVGSRVRLRAPTALTGRIQGTVMEKNEQTLLLSGPDGQPIRVPRAAISQLELSTGRRGNPLKGTLIGAAIGAAAFAVIPSDDFCADLQPGESCPSKGEQVALGAVGGAFWGVILGLVIKGDRWSAVPLGSASVTLAPVRGGARASLTLSF